MQVQVNINKNKLETKWYDKPTILDTAKQGISKLTEYR